MALARRSPVAGFSLVEALVALSVFAVLAIALSSNLGQISFDDGQVEQRVMANWIAANKLASLRIEAASNRLQASALVPLVSEQTDFAGRRWLVETAFLATADASLYRVEVSVSPEAQDWVARKLVGFLAVGSP